MHRLFLWGQCLAFFWCQESESPWVTCNDLTWSRMCLMRQGSQKTWLRSFKYQGLGVQLFKCLDKTLSVKVLNQGVLEMERAAKVLGKWNVVLMEARLLEGMRLEQEDCMRQLRLRIYFPIKWYSASQFLLWGWKIINTKVKE